MLATPVPDSIATGRLTLSRERRGPATIVSLLIHGAIVAFVLWRSAEMLGEGGGGPGARGGGGGRGRMRAVFFTAPAYAVPQMDIPTPPTVALPVMTTPVIPLDLARIDVPQPQAQATVTGPATGVGPGAGGGQGAGQGTGIGNTVGPGTGGDAGYIIAAQPLWIVPTWTAPASLHGKTIKVRFWVSPSGMVDKFEIDPEITDAGFRQKFLRALRDFKFKPGVDMRDGHAVASVVTAGFTF